MDGINWTFQDLVNFRDHPSFKPIVFNPIIKRLLSTFPGSCIYGAGGHSVVLRLSPGIAAKVSLEAGDERLRNEQAVFRLLAESNCPHFIRDYLHASDVSFVELMPNRILHDRILHMSKPKPWPVLTWMLQLSHAAASLESIGYVHGDINPFNILFDDNDDLKLIDFDHSLKIGDNLDVGCEPYIRQGRDLKGGQNGTAGPVTEQFALGSVFWYMTRGSELYSELEGHVQVNLLYDGIFPATDPQDPIDRIISNCWNGHYPKIADLVDEIQAISELKLQTRDDKTSSQGQEQKLLCEEYCKMADLTLLTQG